MKSFINFLYEAKGRKPSNKHYSDDLNFIRNNIDNKQINLTQQINQLKKKYLNAIAKSDKKMIDAEEKSLKELKDFIDTNKIELPNRMLMWKVHEKDVAAGINNLFKSGFFKIKTDKMTVELKNNKHYSAEIVGGSNQSDVKVSNTNSNKNFFIECKLNLQTSEYFKFGLSMNGDKIIYNHKDFITKKDNKEQIDKINQLFKKIDLSNFLTDLVKNNELNQYWKQFNQNIKDIEVFLNNNDEYKQFISKNKLGNEYPKAFQQMSKVFELYCKYYIEKYNTLVDDLFDLLTYDEILRQKENFKIHEKRTSTDVQQSETFKKMTELQVNISAAEEALNDKIIKDQKQFNVIIQQIKKIETKLTTLLKNVGKDPNDFSGLNDIPKKEQLKYFFQMFLSSTGRKKNGKSMLLRDFDEDGNMQICPEYEQDNSKLGQMITDFYVKKDNCAYVQIANVVYQFEKVFNPLAIPNLPMFKEHFTKFSIKMIVSDQLDRISLHIKALENDKNDLSKFNVVSFIEKDNNYVGKFFKNGITINIKQ